MSSNQISTVKQSKGRVAFGQSPEYASYLQRYSIPHGLVNIIIFDNVKEIDCLATEFDILWVIPTHRHIMRTKYYQHQYLISIFDSTSADSYGILHFFSLKYIYISLDFKILRCHLNCTYSELQKGHFHCPFCNATRSRKDNIYSHVTACHREGINIFVEEMTLTVDLILISPD